MARYAWGPHHPISIILPSSKQKTALPAGISCPCSRSFYHAPALCPAQRPPILPVDRISGPRPTGSIFQLPRYPCVSPRWYSPGGSASFTRLGMVLAPAPEEPLRIPPVLRTKNAGLPLGLSILGHKKKSSGIKATALSCTLYRAPSVRFAY